MRHSMHYAEMVEDRLGVLKPHVHSEIAAEANYSTAAI